MNRNRILNFEHTKSFQYIHIPIKKHPKGSLISQVKINQEEPWKVKIYGQLSIYKKLNAPHYKATLTLIKGILDSTDDSFLNLSINSTKMICNYLDIPFRYKIASQLNFHRGSIHKADDWALTISKYLNASTYFNAPSGYAIFDDHKYKKNGIKLTFIQPILTPYSQSKRDNFVKGLSIIDLLMFNSKEQVKQMIMSNSNLCSHTEMSQQKC